MAWLGNYIVSWWGWLIDSWMKMNAKACRSKCIIYYRLGKCLCVYLNYGRVMQTGRGIFPFHVWFVHFTSIAVKSVINGRISSHWNRERFYSFTTLFPFAFYTRNKQVNKNGNLAELSRHWKGTLALNVGYLVENPSLLEFFLFFFF